MIGMYKEIYDGMNDRLKYLESLEQTEEIKNRIYEITLCIIDVQQKMLLQLDRKPMPQEIERKFLVKGEYKSLAVSEYKIIQGYISSNPAVRIRIKNDRAYITIKSKTNETGVSRYEFEKEILVEEANELLLLCREGKIDKTRYNVKVGNHTFEVDEFHGDNEGLTIAEVELQSENESYDVPEWLGKEVTGNKKYYNSYLSKNPFKKKI